MRRKRRNVLRAQPATRSDLEELHGRVWDTAELARDYIITAIIDHTVVVRRKADDVVGTLRFQQGPSLLYHTFVQQVGADP